MTKDKTYREDWLDKILAEYKIGFVVGDKDIKKHLSEFKKAIQEHIEGEKYLNASEVLNEYLDSKDSNDQKVYMDGYLEWLKAQLKQLKDKGRS